jgi:hypothetical protein
MTGRKPRVYWTRRLDHERSHRVREKDGTPLKLRFTYDSGEVLNKSLATVIKSQLSEVGIDVETQGMDMYAWWMPPSPGVRHYHLEHRTALYLAAQLLYAMLSSSPHTFALTALEGAEEFKAAILEFARRTTRRASGDFQFPHQLLQRQRAGHPADLCEGHDRLQQPGHWRV